MDIKLPLGATVRSAAYLERITLEGDLVPLNGWECYFPKIGRNAAIIYEGISESEATEKFFDWLKKRGFIP